MSGRNKVVAELMRGLRHERDELNLQMHLAGKEVQDQWNQLNDRFIQLNDDYEPLKDAVKETSDDVWDSLKLVGEELREGFHRIRQSL
tara:strand:- start:122024 stop:122287 length:264 start_codon:yes stop_codon:yes gene_type:complete